MKWRNKRDVLTMYISFTENNAEPNTSSAIEEPHTSSTGWFFFVYMTFYQLFNLTLFNILKQKKC